MNQFSWLRQLLLILNYLKEVKLYVLEKGFDKEEDEIHFFKKLKPDILSKLIYYNAIFKIESKKPHGPYKLIKKYLSNEQIRLKKNFYNNLDFYKYYRTNSTYLDQKYFVRGKHDIKLSLDTYFFESDHNFSTSHDYKVAKILANDLIQVYLEDRLSHLQKRSKPKNHSNLKTNTENEHLKLINNAATGRTELRPIIPN